MNRNIELKLTEKRGFKDVHGAVLWAKDIAELVDCCHMDNMEALVDYIGNLCSSAPVGGKVALDYSTPWE